MTFDQLLSISGTAGRRIELATHLGTPIDNETCEPGLKLNPGRRHRERIFESRYTQVRSALAGYNCFGHVFASRRTAIYSPDIDEILCEDGFSHVSEDNACVQDVVVYFDDDGPVHVAVIVRQEPLIVGSIETRLIVLSKFDDVSGEYEHALGDTSWIEWPVQWNLFRPRGSVPRAKPPDGWVGALKRLEGR